MGDLAVILIGVATILNSVALILVTRRISQMRDRNGWRVW